MNTAAVASTRIRLRAATPADIEVIAGLWHSAWRDGHLAYAPQELLAHRQLEHFRQRVPERLAATTVATEDERIVGFVTVREKELEQLFVAAEARGSGVAALLIQQAEKAIATRFDVAWLAVATENARARRFYERSGWHDAAALAYQAQIAGGAITVPCRRYEKRVRGKA